MNAIHRLPALFIGHGSPLTAFEDNDSTRTWAALGTSMPKPRAILCISAHWYTNGTGITASAQPRTVHDYYGFPDHLYEYHYRAPGDPQLALRIAETLQPLQVIQDQQWGYDHGCFTVLKHMYPQANIPVLQLSMDGSQNAEWHFALGQRLQPLREQGILVMGSGNVVHNLRAMRREPNAAAHPLAQQFNDQVRRYLEQRDFDALIHYERLGAAARFSAPTPEHYLPMLYVLGASHADEPLSVFLDNIQAGAISNFSVSFGEMAHA